MNLLRIKFCNKNWWTIKNSNWSLMLAWKLDLNAKQLKKHSRTKNKKSHYTTNEIKIKGNGGVDFWNLFI